MPGLTAARTGPIVAAMTGFESTLVTVVPPAVLVALLLFVWRDLRGELRDLRTTVTAQGERLARIEGRLDPTPPPSLLRGLATGEDPAP